MRRVRGVAAMLVLGTTAAWPSAARAGEPPPGDTATTAPGAADALTGTLLDDGEPVEGTEITVETVTGDEVATVETDEEGTWRVPVPGPGRYRAAIDVDTLPDGVELRDPDRTTLEVDVFAGRPTTVLFALGEGAGGGPSLIERLAQSTTNGIKFGLIIAMTAIGLSLIFGTTGLINFAHGELVTLGAVVAWFLNARGPHWQLVLAGAVAVAIAGIVGAALELGIWRPLRARQVGLFQLFVITIGLALVIRHVILIWFGGLRRSYTDYTIQDRWDLGPVSITPRDFAVIVLSIVVLVAIATMLQRTRMGKAMRAVSDNVELSEASGIDVQRIVLAVWIVGVALAALGGIFLGAVVEVDFEMGGRLLLLMFAGVILGGLGTAYGAMVGGIIVGIVTEVSTIWISPSLKLVFALGALVLALLIRPQGILGRAERVG